MKKIKPLALFLPQFHQIPENDEWWGEGFTEWVNVKKAKPLFEEHYQPRIPLGEKYYDLSNTSSIKEQANLAKKHGIYGFVSYHYWFNGKKLLEKPMELYLEDQSIDFPFCFSWANEHWTNAWVSGENKILMEQNFDDPKDWVEHFNYLLPFFKDKRYIKEDNKPLFIIYLPSIIGPLKEMMDCWQKMAKENGFRGIKFAYQHSIYHLDKKAKKELFDYSIEFEPSLSMKETSSSRQKWVSLMKVKLSIFLQTKLKLYIKLKQSKVQKYNYDEIWKNILERNPSSSNAIAGAFIDWDNTARRGNKGSVMEGANPQKFEKYFERLVNKVEREYSTDKIIIFAWNEWAEGGYLEPDEKYKYSYLEAIKKVMDKRNKLNE